MSSGSIILCTKLEDYDEDFLLVLPYNSWMVMSSGSIILCTKLEDYDEDFLLVLLYNSWMVMSSGFIILCTKLEDYDEDFFCTSVQLMDGNEQWLYYFFILIYKTVALFFCTSVLVDGDWLYYFMYKT